MTNPELTMYLASELFDTYVTTRTHHVTIADDTWFGLRPDKEDYDLIYVHDIKTQHRLSDELPASFDFDGNYFNAPYDLSTIPLMDGGVVSNLNGTLYNFNFRPIAFDTDRVIYSDEILAEIRKSIGLVDRLLVINYSDVVKDWEDAGEYGAGWNLRSILDIFPNTTVIVFKDTPGYENILRNGNFIESSSFSYFFPSEEHSATLYGDTP